MSNTTLQQRNVNASGGEIGDRNDDQAMKSYHSCFRHGSADKRRGSDVRNNTRLDVGKDARIDTMFDTMFDSTECKI